MTSIVTVPVTVTVSDNFVLHFRRPQYLLNTMSGYNETGSVQFEIRQFT